MYPESILWWFGAVVILTLLLAMLGMLVWWLDHKFQNHIEKRHKAPPRDDQ